MVHAYETAGVHIHEFSCVCSSKHICLLFAHQNPLTFECRRQDTSLCSVSRKTARSEYFSAHTHIMHPSACTHSLPWGTPMQLLGSAKWNFLKAKKTFLSNKLVSLNNTTLVFPLFSHGSLSLPKSVGCFRKKRSGLLFWYQKTVLHDRWQKSSKLFRVNASSNAF